MVRDSCYLHLPVVVGIIFMAPDIEEAHVRDPLGMIPALALFGETAL